MTRSVLCFLLLAFAVPPAFADGFHSPLLTKKDPKKWAITEREKLGLDESDSAEEAPRGGGVGRRAAARPLIDVLRYLDKKNVLLREFPDFNYDNIPGFKTETESLLIALGADAVPLLVETLVTDLKGQLGSAGDLRPVSDFRERVIKILIAIGEPSIDRVVANLKDPDSRVQNTMLRILREIVKSPDFGKDADAWNRWHLIFRAGRDRDVSAVKRLIALLDDKDPRIRSAAADALGTIGSRKATPALLRLLHEENDPERIRKLIRAVVRTREITAAPDLIGFLSHTRSDIRQEAVTGLRFLTHQMLNYDPRGSAADREAGIARWRTWWERREGR